jgi:hypothetical protein
MKTSRVLAALLPALTLIAWSGCGDDDDRSDEAETSNPRPIVSPENPFTQEKSYNATLDNGQQVGIRFPTVGQYELSRDGTTQTGTLSNVARNGNVWTVNLTPDEGQQAAQNSSLRLEFTTAQTGLWTFTSEGAPAENGTFIMQIAPSGGDTGGPPGRVEPIDKTLQLIYPGNVGEKFHFVSESSVSYQDGLEAGTYTYDPNNHQLMIVLANGWRYDIILAEDGTATVTFRQSESAEPVIQTATYTLQ